MFLLFEGAYRRQQEPLTSKNQRWKNNWREHEKSCLKNDEIDRRHILTPKWSQLGTVSYSIRSVLKNDGTTALDKTRSQLTKKRQYCDANSGKKTRGRSPLAVVNNLYLFSSSEFTDRNIFKRTQDSSQPCIFDEFPKGPQEPIPTTKTSLEIAPFLRKTSWHRISMRVIRSCTFSDMGSW